MTGREIEPQKKIDGGEKGAEGFVKAVEGMAVAMLPDFLKGSDGNMLTGPQLFTALTDRAKQSETLLGQFAKNEVGPEALKTHIAENEAAAHAVQSSSAQRMKIAQSNLKSFG